MSPNHNLFPNGLRIGELLEELMFAMAADDDSLMPVTPREKAAREQFAQYWACCQDDLLSKTKVLKVWPEPNPYPRTFRFELARPYKQKLGPDDPVTLAPGPIRGVIIYRPDPLSDLKLPSVAVRLDSTLGFLHPNFSRRYGLLCLGHLPPGPFPLDALLENHLYPILTYQNRHPHDPADLEAARYFATNPDAMSGLEPVPPLY